MSAAPLKSYTLAGSQAWQQSQLNHPMNRPYHFTQREQDFINEAFDSEEEDEGFTGTKVELIEPSGPDCHWSQISSDHEEDQDLEMTDAEDIPTPEGQPKTTRKGKFKKIAKKLYPRKMVGGAKVGAKVMGGAIRHPMATTRKVNKFVRRKNNNTSNTRGVGMTQFSNHTVDDLPPLTRSATVSEWDTRPRDGPQCNFPKDVVDDRWFATSWGDFT